MTEMNTEKTKEVRKKQPLYKSLYLQVLTAIVIGVLLGHFYPTTGAAMQPFGNGFIKLIKMMIAPIIFCTVVLGISGMESMKKVGKTGAIALLYFEILTTFALVIGLLIVDFVRPGSGMNVNPATLDMKSVAAYTGPGKMQTTTQFLMERDPGHDRGGVRQGRNSASAVLCDPLWFCPAHGGRQG